MKAILLDIEGTTTPIDFVHKILFPSAKERMGGFVESHFSLLHDAINQLVEESAHDATYTVPFDPTEPGSVSAYLEHLIDENRKSTPLKYIQGKIWQKGYLSGELVAPVFDDVPRAFRRWHAGGIEISIFSSGSVLAQELLFRYSDHGDLSNYISNYFDTHVGGKRERQSYSAIAGELKKDAHEVLFVSDVVDELDAARDAGLTTALALRPGNAPIDADVAHRLITTFDDLE